MGSDRFARQQGLVPRDKLEGLLVTVIGVGAIGREVTRQLALLGVRRLQLIDFDHVEEMNITTQGYLPRDLGLPKVSAAATMVGEIDRDIARRGQGLAAAAAARQARAATFQSRTA